MSNQKPSKKYQQDIDLVVSLEYTQDSDVAKQTDIDRVVRAALAILLRDSTVK